MDSLTILTTTSMVGPLVGAVTNRHCPGCCTGAFQHCPAAVEVAGLLKKVMENPAKTEEP